MSENARNSRINLWLLGVLCAAPVIASYVTYYFWQPIGQVNYGELIEPRALPDTQLALADGTPFHWRGLRGKWLLVTADSGRCSAHCQQKLVYLRQVRLAQGKERERIERIWLVTDESSPDAALVAQHQGAWLVRTVSSDFLKLFPAQGALADHVYVIDPLGNLMMRYPRDFDPRRMIKDIARLLRPSKWQ